MKTLTGLLLAFLAASTAWGCAWDSNTLADDLALEGRLELFDVVTGQFPHHGPAFYEAQLARSQAVLAKSSQDWAARDDYAVALMKLERYEESLTQLEAQLAEDPQRYETLSNLGVLHKKRGEFRKAADYIERALEQKPAGHMGLGDVYLRMLRYQARLHQGPLESENDLPEDHHFLGDAYGTAGYRLAENVLGDSPPTNGERPNEVLIEYLLAMIRNDRTFSDTYVVLGDLLQHERQPNLALWCYARAKQLGHPKPELIEEAVARIYTELSEQADYEWSSLHYVNDPQESFAAYGADLERAQAWLADYKALEAQRTKAGEPCDFGSVLTALEASGVERMRSEGHGTQVGLPALWRNVGRLRLVLLLAGCVLAYVAARKGLRRKRQVST